MTVQYVSHRSRRHLSSGHGHHCLVQQGQPGFDPVEVDEASPSPIRASVDSSGSWKRSPISAAAAKLGCAVSMSPSKTARSATQVPVFDAVEWAFVEHPLTALDPASTSRRFSAVQQRDAAQNAQRAARAARTGTSPLGVRTPPSGDAVLLPAGQEGSGRQALEVVTVERVDLIRGAQLAVPRRPRRGVRRPACHDRGPHQPACSPRGRNVTGRSAYAAGRRPQ